MLMPVQGLFRQDDRTTICTSLEYRSFRDDCLSYLLASNKLILKMDSGCSLDRISVNVESTSKLIPTDSAKSFESFMTVERPPCLVTVVRLAHSIDTFGLTPCLHPR